MAQLSDRPPLRRFHHVAYVVKDPERTRYFYEDLVGLPLVATWAERGEVAAYPGRPVEFCHLFFGLSDGAALAFFAFAEEEVYEAVRQNPRNGFTHPAIAVSPEAQQQMRARLEAAGHSPALHRPRLLPVPLRGGSGPDVAGVHCDPPDAAATSAWQSENAHEALARWLAGDRTPNNDLRNR